MAKLIPHFALAEKSGSRLEIDADTVGELIERSIAEHGEPFAQAAKSAAIVVNGRDVALLEGKKTKLGPDDTVWMLLPAGGG